MYLQDFTIFFTQLNSEYNESENKVLPPYVKFTLPQGGTAQGMPLPLLQFQPYSLHAFRPQLKKINKTPCLYFNIFVLMILSC